MPHERPDAKELIEAVSEFLSEKVVPNLPGQGGFHARVAANGLTIALRELEQGPALTAAEQVRLQSILGHKGEATDLNVELVEQIRAGDLPADRSKLLAHLRATVRDKLLVANPKYLLPEDRPDPS